MVCFVLSLDRGISLSFSLYYNVVGRKYLMSYCERRSRGEWCIQDYLLYDLSIISIFIAISFCFPELPKHSFEKTIFMTQTLKFNR